MEQRQVTRKIESSFKNQNKDMPVTLLWWKSIEIFLSVHVTVLRLHSRDSRRPNMLEVREFSTKECTVKEIVPESQIASLITNHPARRSYNQ